MGGRVGVEAFSIWAFSVSLSALKFVVSKFTWRFSKSFSVHRQIWGLVVFRVFRALPVPIDKFCLWIYAFQKISHTFGFAMNLQRRRIPHDSPREHWTQIIARGTCTLNTARKQWTRNMNCQTEQPWCQECANSIAFFCFLFVYSDERNCTGECDLTILLVT